MKTMRRKAAIATPYFATNDILGMLKKKNVPETPLNSAMNEVDWELHQIIVYPGENIIFRNPSHRELVITIRGDDVKYFYNKPTGSGQEIVVRVPRRGMGNLRVKDGDLEEDVVVEFSAEIGDREVRRVSTSFQQVAGGEGDEDCDEDGGTKRTIAERPVIIIRGGPPPSSFLLRVVRKAITVIVSVLLALLFGALWRRR